MGGEVLESIGNNTNLDCIVVDGMSLSGGEYEVPEGVGGV